MNARALAALVAVALAGCTVGPDYVRPGVDTPASWRIDYPKAADVANAKWWEQFGDPVLDELIDTALRENRDIPIAAARVDQFLGPLDSTRAQLFPQIGYGMDASRARASQVGQPPLLLGLNAARSLNGIPMKSGTTILGILALEWGALLAAGQILNLPFEVPVFEILLISLGVIILAQVLLSTRRQPALG